MRTNGTIIARLAIGAAVCAVLTGCDDKSDQQEARDKIATASCDYFQRCNEIGPGKMFSSRDDCQVQQTNTWQMVLPPNACDGKVNQNQVNRCLATIGLFECGDAIDFLQVLSECNQARVCSGSGADASGG